MFGGPRHVKVAGPQGTRMFGGPRQTSLWERDAEFAKTSFLRRRLVSAAVAGYLLHIISVLSLLVSVSSLVLAPNAPAETGLKLLKSVTFISRCFKLPGNTNVCILLHTEWVRPADLTSDGEAGRAAAARSFPRSVTAGLGGGGLRSRTGTVYYMPLVRIRVRFRYLPSQIPVSSESDTGIFRVS